MLFTPLLGLAAYASAAPAGTTVPTSSLASTSTSSSSVAPSATSDAPLPSPTVAYASDDPNDSLLNQYQSGTPEPERGAAGAKILGPQNLNMCSCRNRRVSAAESR